MKCPFCREDAKLGKEKKFYLSLNTVDQVFKCWFCKESGGVFRLIALLEGAPEGKVIEQFRKHQKDKKLLRIFNNRSKRYVRNGKLPL